MGYCNPIKDLYLHRSKPITTIKVNLMAENDNQVTMTEDNTVAVVSYLTLIGFIIALIIHQNKKTELGAFHLREMLGLLLFAVGLQVLSLLPLLGIIALLAQIALFVLWLLGLINAINKEKKLLPIVGDLFQRWFATTF
jgi:uncharacterized membrane protein